MGKNSRPPVIHELHQTKCISFTKPTHALDRWLKCSFNTFFPWMFWFYLLSVAIVSNNYRCLKFNSVYTTRTSKKRKKNNTHKIHMHNIRGRAPKPNDWVPYAAVIYGCWCDDGVDRSDSSGDVNFPNNLAGCRWVALCEWLAAGWRECERCAWRSRRDGVVDVKSIVETAQDCDANEKTKKCICFIGSFVYCILHIIRDEIQISIQR